LRVVVLEMVVEVVVEAVVLAVIVSLLPKIWLLEAHTPLR
jgi:hypothetical protein